jgi:SAM-dependent methyltransferase
MARAGHELTEAAQVAASHGETYGAAYFGWGRDPSGDRGGLSGYASYDRITSNAEIAGYLLWRTFGGARRTLDVGCATGFVVEVLRELGVDAEGCDVSEYAVAHASPGPRATCGWPTSSRACRGTTASSTW